MPVNLLDFDAKGMEAWFAGMGERPFRARQVLAWIHKRGAGDFAAMTDLAKDLRAKLEAKACIRLPEIVGDSTAADEAALALAQARYRAGLGNYLTVLTAQSSVLAKQTLTVDLRARALDLDAGLARALGGGFAGESLAAR